MTKKIFGNKKPLTRQEIIIMLADKGMTREQIENSTIEWISTVIFAPRDEKDGQLLLYKDRNIPAKNNNKKRIIYTDPIDLYIDLYIARGFPKEKVMDYLGKVKQERDQLLKEAGL